MSELIGKALCLHEYTCKSYYNGKTYHFESGFNYDVRVNSIRADSGLSIFIGEEPAMDVGSPDFEHYFEFIPLDYNPLKSSSFSQREAPKEITYNLQLIFIKDLSPTVAKLEHNMVGSYPVRGGKIVISSNVPESLMEKLRENAEHIAIYLFMSYRSSIIVKTFQFGNFNFQLKYDGDIKIG